MAAAVLAIPQTSFFPLTRKRPVLLAPQKRNICIFDPKRREHNFTLRKLLDNLATLLWFERFSKDILDNGGLAHGVNTDDIESWSPAVIIAELEVISEMPDWNDGIRLLENYRRGQRFDIGTRLIVVSSHNAILGAHKEFKRLGVDSVFTWDSLRNRELRERFVAAVREGL
jgi:hypothetical protein